MWTRTEKADASLLPDYKCLQTRVIFTLVHEFITQIICFYIDHIMFIQLKVSNMCLDSLFQVAVVFQWWSYCNGAVRNAGGYAALTTAVVISGTGDKHYFPSNSQIMSVLPHGWLSKANPEPLTPAEGLCVQGGRHTICVCVCVRVRKRGQRMIYTLALLEYNPLSQLLSKHSSCFYLLFALKPLSYTFQQLLRSLSFVRQWLAAGAISSNLFHFVICAIAKCCFSYCSCVS